MENQKLILVETLCLHYELEITFFESLEDIGLIALVKENNQTYITEERVSDLEKVLRLHKDLEVNLEGIDVIFNLMKKIERLQSELDSAKEQLRFFSSTG